MWETILTGISIVVGVANVLSEQRAAADKSELEHGLAKVNQRISALHAEISDYHAGKSTQETVLASYKTLIGILRENMDFNRELIFLPTDYGTYKILRRRKSSHGRLVIRDSNGVY